MKLNIRYVEEILRRRQKGRQRSSLTLVQKVRSFTWSWQIFSYCCPLRRKPWDIDFSQKVFFSLLSCSNMCNFKIQTSCVGVKPAVKDEKASECVWFDLILIVGKGVRLNDRVDVLYIFKCNCWCQIWGSKREESWRSYEDKSLKYEVISWNKHEPKGHDNASFIQFDHHHWRL